ncbi:GNAT family N-acetyltransferase [Glutamicibacter sp. BW77]|uniref:GNAT family N-acetyltransferase n=1 Tax=Glutamicibacter TaxID=1742989 RepID=UPI000BB84E5F|nr:GNAT family N-acetyltransferase [Glutamicibacter sp. BW77]PCC37372.1 hypothetical protein CIK74_00750 [Glutamicibacter sp. BW77]
MSSATPQGINLEFFAAEQAAKEPEQRWVSFSRAVGRGFHDPGTDADSDKILAEMDLQDGVQYIGAYDRSALAPSLHVSDPVGTYQYYPGTLNVGGQNCLTVHQITAVTVSPTHRRRGILRSMITTHLQQAAGAGVPVAVLTATEATIYGRFGFGLAAEQCRFELNVEHGARLRRPHTGSVVAVDPASIKEQMLALRHEHQQVTVGAVSHRAFDIGRDTGAWENHGNLKPVKNLRAAVHYDAQGTADGYLTYTFEGWAKETATMSVKTLCTTNGAARLELLDYLGAHDLIKRVTGSAPVDDVLPIALENPRSYRVLGRDDHLWLRILDLPAAFSARNYHGDAQLVIAVSDELGYTAGTWQLQVVDGRMSVQRVEGQDPEAWLDCRELASLYLGTRSATQLAEAGLLDTATPQLLTVLDRLFAGRQAPYCQVDF